MGLGIVKTSWTTVILPPYSSSIILGYLIYRKTFTHSIIPMHTDSPEKLKEILPDKKVIVLQDKEVYTV